jgi:hypothetical protein
MFTSVLEKILTALAEISEFKTTDAWMGDVADLLQKVQKLPSAHVMLSVGEFDEPLTLRGELNPSETTWSIVVLCENLRDRKTGLVESLALIEALLAYAEPAKNQPPFPAGTKLGLTRLDTGYGRLWPSTVQFLGAEGSKAAYGIKFYNKKGH